jgi:hypothetical protein
MILLGEVAARLGDRVFGLTRSHSGRRATRQENTIDAGARQWRLLQVLFCVFSVHCGSNPPRNG